MPPDHRAAGVRQGVGLPAGEQRDCEGAEPVNVSRRTGVTPKLLGSHVPEGPCDRAPAEIVVYHRVAHRPEVQQDEPGALLA